MTEVALNFKNHGNELYAQKSYKDAIEAYTSGVKAGPSDQALRISLLNNRAQSHLFLKNYGAALRDAGVIIALCIQDQKPPPVKALYRAAQALVALERWKEAKDVVKRGREMPGEENKPEWKKLEDDAEKGQRRVVERFERERRAKLGKSALRKAVESRGLVVVDTSSPPDNPHPLHFDPEVAPLDPPLYQPEGSTWIPTPIHCPLIFPVFLLYPEYAQSDLITHFDENNSVGDHMKVMFPASPDVGGWAGWDEKKEYWNGNLVVYVETAQQRLLKVGKELTLREVLAKAVKEEEGKKDGIILRDGLLSFVVLVKGAKEKAWIEEFKRKRDEDKEKK